MCDASDRLGSDSVVPWPSTVMVLPLTEQFVPVSPRAGHVAASTVLKLCAATGDGAGQ